MRYLEAVYGIIIFSALSVFWKNDNCIPAGSMAYFSVSSKIQYHSDISQINIGRLAGFPKQTLTGRLWKVDFLQHVIDGQYSFFERGRKNTTGLNYNNMSFKFGTNGTGVHTSCNKQRFSFHWKWLSGDHKKLSIHVNGKTDIWNMVEVVGAYLYGSANIIVNNNSNNLETFRLIQL